MYALILEDLTVDSIIVADVEFLANAPAEWKAQWTHIVECPATVGYGWSYDPNTQQFSPPPPPPEEEA
jgi:hypothetical protein